MIIYFYGFVITFVALLNYTSLEDPVDKESWWCILLFAAIWPVTVGVLIGEIAHQTFKK